MREATAMPSSKLLKERIESIQDTMKDRRTPCT